MFQTVFFVLFSCIQLHVVREFVCGAVQFHFCPLMRTPTLMTECPCQLRLFWLKTEFMHVSKKHITVRVEESVEQISPYSPLVFSGSFAVKRIETVVVHVTIDTERHGDS